MSCIKGRLGGYLIGLGIADEENEEVCVDVVTDIAHVKDNIRELERGRIALTGVEAKEYRALIKRGTCFVPYVSAIGLAFAPSRFIGYVGNKLLTHRENSGRDGRITNPAICKILGSEPLANDLLERRYLEFCQEIGVKPSVAGSFGVKRRFWITADAEAFLFSLETSETEPTMGDVVEEQVPEEYTGRLEGQTILVQALRRARSIINRQRAIECHGVICAVCGFDFEKMYGSLGRGFIEIHHLTPLGEADEEVTVNPKTDLIPLCANCHRMVHRGKEGVLNPDELRTLVNLQSVLANNDKALTDKVAMRES